MTTIALIGAGGKMGCRITDNLKKGSNPVYYVEISERGLNNLAERRLSATPQDEAVANADVIVLAIPDVAIGNVSETIVPAMKSGAILMVLDPAAAYLGKLPKRGDVTYFVTHPCHPPVFNDETTPEAKRDFFGGVAAKQAIVCALMQGPEEDYAKGEEIARKLWGPVLRSHRVTVEQMAILEPVLSETVTATCLTVIREAVDEAAERGVPFEAARDFVLGHINVELAILFDELDWSLSAGAQKAVEEAKKDIFQPDWRKVFEPENIKESVAKITTSEKV